MTQQTPDEQQGRPSRITHSRPGIGQQQTKPATPTKPGALEPEPVQMAEAEGPLAATRKISAFGKEKKHEESWGREPTVTGSGATHVKTFHGKLTDDSLAYMDQQINEWLDAHPELEVKFVSSTVGILSGKLKEPHLVCQVWV